MNPTKRLSRTQKALDELKNRTYRLSLKKRSVLILLERPQTVEYILDKAVLGQDDLIEEISALVADGFLEVDGGQAHESVHAKMSPIQATETASDKGASSESSAFIQGDIILSEARFLMVNYCVDVFGTKSQHYVDMLGQCKSVSQFEICAKNIYQITKIEHPESMKTFRAVIKEINDTA